MPYDWPQGITLRHFGPDEFRYPELMDTAFLRLLDELRDRCGFPMRVNSDARKDSDMARIYGHDRTKWPDSAHWVRPPGYPRAKAADVETAGAFPILEKMRKDMQIAYVALQMLHENLWTHLGLEIATGHVHVDNYAEHPRGNRPWMWPGVSR